MTLIPDKEFDALSKAAPDPERDLPKVSSFWRRRAALTLGLWDRNAPWVDIIGDVEYREYQRDRAFADGLALRHLRVEVERLRPVIAAAKALAEIERTRTSQTEHSSVWLEGHRDAVQSLVRAVAAA